VTALHIIAILATAGIALGALADLAFTLVANASRIAAALHARPLA